MPSVAADRSAASKIRPPQSMLSTISRPPGRSFASITGSAAGSPFLVDVVEDHVEWPS